MALGNPAENFLEVKEVGGAVSAVGRTQESPHKDRSPPHRGEDRSALPWPCPRPGGFDGCGFRITIAEIAVRSTACVGGAAAFPHLSPHYRRDKLAGRQREPRLYSLRRLTYSVEP